MTSPTSPFLAKTQQSTSLQVGKPRHKPCCLTQLPSTSTRVHRQHSVGTALASPPQVEYTRGPTSRPPSKMLVHMKSRTSRFNSIVLNASLAFCLLASPIAIVDLSGSAGAAAQRNLPRQPVHPCHASKTNKNSEVVGSIATGVLLVVTTTVAHTPHSRLNKFEVLTATSAVGGCFLYVSNKYGIHIKSKWFVRRSEPVSKRLILIRYLRRDRLFSAVRVIRRRK